MPNNYLFIVNDLMIGGSRYSGDYIAETLLQNGIWMCNEVTPNVRKFEEGDKGIVYVAGKGNRIFYGNFTIASRPEKANSTCFPKDIQALSLYFPMIMKLDCINIWPNKVPINEIKDLLTFINKRNYGLYFRQANRKLSDYDLEIILRSGNK